MPFLAALIPLLASAGSAAASGIGSALLGSAGAGAAGGGAGALAGGLPMAGALGSSGLFAPLAGGAAGAAGPAAAGLGALAPATTAATGLGSTGLLGSGGSLGGGMVQNAIGSPAGGWTGANPSQPGSGLIGMQQNMTQAGFNPLQGIQSLLGGNKSPMAPMSLTPPGPPSLYPMSSGDQDPMAWLKAFTMQGA